MGMFDRFKNKTVEDIVASTKESISVAVNTGVNDKLKAVLYLLPVVVTAVIIFKDDHAKTQQSKDIPTKQIINNYYYYAERQEKRNVANSSKSGC